jgi:hypothetical protein
MGVAWVVDAVGMDARQQEESGSAVPAVSFEWLGDLEVVECAATLETSIVELPAETARMLREIRRLDSRFRFVPLRVCRCD